ncbi:4'-phosphopantetheinyl transferase superfamily protein [Streptomyces sp. NBC_01216]|nr:4'-phosphopantetheinyl transferase superfamily protein [Streptomyces sp. NBC_01216]
MNTAPPAGDGPVPAVGRNHMGGPPDDARPAPGADRTPRETVAVLAATAEVLARPGLGEHLLAPWERRRLTRIRTPRRRDDVVAARLLLRLCLARVTGLPPRSVALAQRCDACGRHGHGRPHVPGRPGWGVSLSHTDGLVAAAVGPGPVGVDVEPAARRPGPPRVLARLLPETELRAAATADDPGPALLRLWVRREALFKAGRDDLPLLEWTDGHRAAVVAVAGTFPVAVLSLSAVLPPAGLHSASSR